MKVTYSSEINRVFCLLYGKSKLGKTPLAATAPKPIFVDVENKMVTIKNKKVPRLRAESWKDAKAALKFLKKDKDHKTVVIDSLSELAEIRYAEAKKQDEEEGKSNKFAKYEVVFEDIMWFIKELKKLPHNVVCICKAKPSVVEDQEMWRPMFPGRALSPAIPYQFDIILALVAYDDDEEAEDEKPTHERGKVLLTKMTEIWEAGSPDSLKKLECFDMTKIFKKVLK